MRVAMGYICKSCNKVYCKMSDTLPVYCKRCGTTLVEKRYGYCRTASGEVSLSTNIWGGYDYSKTVLSNDAVKVKIRRKLFRWVPMYERPREE